VKGKNESKESKGDKKREVMEMDVHICVCARVSVTLVAIYVTPG